MRFAMAQEWNELTKITRGAEVTIERVRIIDKNIAVEGNFELPQLARLTKEDQMFIVAFIQTHGSIKDMEKMYDISYPTVKRRLSRIVKQLV
jgi:hypothetical protein